MGIVKQCEGKREGDGSAAVVSPKTKSLAALRGKGRIHFDAGAEQEDLAFEGAQCEGLGYLVDGRWGIKRLGALMLRGVERGFVGSMCGLRGCCVELLAEFCKLRDEAGLVGLGPGDR